MASRVEMPMRGALEGRTAIVTGASRGIGFATAETLVGAGARVALFARGERALAEATAKLGPSAIPVRADVGEPDSVRSAFARALDELGRLDVLVNNAGIGRLHRIEDAGDADLRAQVQTNFLGCVYCTRAALPALRATGAGDVVNVSSDSVRNPFPYLAVYAATKGAVEVLTRALRRELAPDGIRVTLVRAGPSATSFAEDWDPELAGQAFGVWRESGLLVERGVLDPHAVADAILHAVTRPPAHSVEEIEVRPSGAATDEPGSDGSS